MTLSIMQRRIVMSLPKCETTLSTLKGLKMGRRSKTPAVLVAPVSSKKQLMNKAAVCKFLGDISTDSLDHIRNDPDQRFPQPLQLLRNSPLWTVDQLEKYVGRKEREVEML
jgi:hypothetical protein